MMIPIIKPFFDDNEARAVARVIASGWVAQGPEVAAFERDFVAAVGAPHACAVSNCTTALHLALLAVGVRPGDEVVTVSHSFIATANAVRYCGAVPVFVDILPDQYNLDPGLLEAAIGERTRAVLCVHQMGMPCDMAAVLAVARRHGIPVVEDAACALGSRYRSGDVFEPIGKPHGDIACFSFHPRKIVTTGEGGMLTTANPEWDAAFRLARQHAMSVPDTARHGASKVIFEEYLRLGYNYRMSDLQAAVGRVQLSRLPEIIARRRALADRYAALLAAVPGVVPPREPQYARSNWQSYCVRLPDGADQRQVLQRLLDASVSAKRGIMCAHLEPAYATESWLWVDADGRRRQGDPEGKALPESRRARDACILLPLFHTMSDADQDRVVVALKDALTA